MLFVIGSSSELLGLSSSLELWFCVLFRLFGVVLVNFPVGRFTRTIISVSLVHVSSVSVDNPSLPCTPVHVLPLFCGLCVVPICSRPRFGGFGGQSNSVMCSPPRFAPVLWTGCRRRPCYSFFSASAGLVRIRRRAWRITVAMVTNSTIMRAVR